MLTPRRTMACSGRGDSILFMVFPATWLAWIRAAPLKPSVRRLRKGLVMKVALVLLTCVLLNSSRELRINTNHLTKAGVVNRATATAHKTSLTFIGTVKSVEPLRKRELNVIPVDFDPRFAVTVYIDSVTSHEGPLEVSTERVFAIHSPVRLFRANVADVILKKFRFKVDWEKSSCKPRFSNLTASVIEDEGVLSQQR